MLKQRTQYDDEFKKCCYAELRNPHLTHYLTHMIARDCIKSHEVAEITKG